MTSTPMPASLRIGYKTYRVEDWDYRESRSAARYGEADHLNAVIRIDTTFGPVQSAETMIHEILHAAYRVSALQTLKDPEEEVVVSALASTLTQVMRDNPALVAWLAEAVGETESESPEEIMRALKVAQRGTLYAGPKGNGAG